MQYQASLPWTVQQSAQQLRECLLLRPQHPIRFSAGGVSYGVGVDGLAVGVGGDGSDVKNIVGLGVAGGSGGVGGVQSGIGSSPDPSSGVGSGTSAGE